MPRDDRDILEVLKFELQFLEQGGYGRLPREAWRSRLIFVDSPTCANFNTTERVPCNECALWPLIPEDARGERVPCDCLPLTPQGDTLESLYRTATQREIEETLGAWLRATIRKIEAERAKEAVTAKDRQ